MGAAAACDTDSSQHDDTIQLVTNCTSHMRSVMLYRLYKLGPQEAHEMHCDRLGARVTLRRNDLRLQWTVCEAAAGLWHIPNAQWQTALYQCVPPPSRRSPLGRSRDTRECSASSRGGHLRYVRGYAMSRGGGLLPVGQSGPGAAASGYTSCVGRTFRER